MKSPSKSVLYSRGHCSGERKEKNVEKETETEENRRKEKRENPSWLALKVATPDKYLAQEHLRRNPRALAVQQRHDLLSHHTDRD